MKAKDRTRHKPAPRDDRSKPAAPEQPKILRTCLGLECGATFFEPRYGNRLCHDCRKKHD